MKCFHHLELVGVNFQFHEAKEGFEILGTPNGSDVFVKEACLRQLQREKSLLFKHSRLQDAQIGFLLLRYCGVAKIMHLLRAVPPGHADEACVQQDEHIAATFEEIIGVKCTER